MRVFVTGATGVIGREAVRAMLAERHEVIGAARSDDAEALLRGLGARPARLDLFDPQAAARALHGVDAVVHLATSIPSGMRAARTDAWRMNDRLRTEATRVLADAARAVGVRRLVAESVALVYGDGGADWLREDRAVRPPWSPVRSALDLESVVQGFGGGDRAGVALRFARLYGPGRASAELIAAVRRRRLPVLGRGDNFVSSVHAADAGRAVAAALALPPGVYNVADDEPVTQREYLGTLAAALGAPSPRRLPQWVGRALLGGMATIAMLSQRVSNERLRTASDWRPRYPGVRQGWAAVIGTAPDG